MNVLLCVFLLQLEAKFKEYEGISSLQNVDFPARILRGVLEVHLFTTSSTSFTLIFVVFSFIGSSTISSNVDLFTSDSPKNLLRKRKRSSGKTS